MGIIQEGRIFQEGIDREELTRGDFPIYRQKIYISSRKSLFEEEKLLEQIRNYTLTTVNRSSSPKIFFFYCSTYIYFDVYIGDKSIEITLQFLPIPIHYYS